jgi:hypothetical protein
MLQADRRTWPADALAEWEERAAVREYLGGLSRDDAEREAEAEVRATWRPPDALARWRQVALFG